MIVRKSFGMHGGFSSSRGKVRSEPVADVKLTSRQPFRMSEGCHRLPLAKGVRRDFHSPLARTPASLPYPDHTRPLDIVSLGEPMYEFSQIPGEGNRYLQGFGGDTTNAAIAAARQGAKVAYVTRLGDDEFGKQFLALWREEGVDSSGVGIDPEAHTAVYFIHHGPQGHVFSYLRAGSAASRMRPAHLPLGSDPRRQVLSHLRHLAGDQRERLRHRVRRHRSGQCSGRQVRLRLQPAPAIVAAAARKGRDHRDHPLADYFLPSLDDVKALSGFEQPEAIVDWSHRLGAKYVALKLGPDGVLASDGQRREHIAAHAVDCVDATGAGDCFAGSSPRAPVPR